ncbi:hypothetical protein SAMD00020551_4958 [Mesobacillus selenatarsenatis SF-1]|uniref:Uncharacterized protein n=1 Tax=Mesobacillus selenatarsenatis (strain DSM 18680 / JCM 14380 / FERM P-15431 / SF-1) TaxID=1321606 RepID=A0A0A8X9V9_MESS1|nr:hypothetical protein SAMD00020551_4958 [Mesobacillus selenatarsenatis SF-1]
MRRRMQKDGILITGEPANQKLVLFYVKWVKAEAVHYPKIA